MSKVPAIELRGVSKHFGSVIALRDIDIKVYLIHPRLKTIEQDIDRREGLDLTDILFSEVSRPGGRSTNGGSD